MRTIAGNWVAHGAGFIWSTPSNRLYRLHLDRGTVIAFCNEKVVMTKPGARGSRVAWWRSFDAAKFACELHEAQRVAEEKPIATSGYAQVQTSAPEPAPEPRPVPKPLTPLDEAEERFTFRVAQALRSKDVGALDVSRRWLTDAISALDEIQRAKWAERDAAARSAK